MAMRIAVSRASVNRLAASARGATRFFSGGKDSIQEMWREREERRKHEADEKAEQDREAARKLNLAFTISELGGSSLLGSSEGETKKSGGSEVAGHDSLGDFGREFIDR